jgi:site-specific recombinase XerC
MGLRDYAVLMVLAKLGLRASEVAALNFDDIDWRSGKILVHGKGRRQTMMPLRHDVGAAIVDSRSRTLAIESVSLLRQSIGPSGNSDDHN